MLEIDVWPPAEHFIAGLESKFAEQIVRKIEQLAVNPRPPKSKVLEGYAPLRRLRSGDYRIVYFVDGNVLKVPLIDKRGDDKVYRSLAKKFKMS
jgi:mRNA-degrading endonuclease RelE of RelBE toxin-antitoxin system